MCHVRGEVVPRGHVDGGESRSRAFPERRCGGVGVHFEIEAYGVVFFWGPFLWWTQSECTGGHDDGGFCNQWRPMYIQHLLPCTVEPTPGCCTRCCGGVQMAPLSSFTANLAAKWPWTCVNTVCRGYHMGNLCSFVLTKLIPALGPSITIQRNHPGRCARCVHYHGNTTNVHVRQVTVTPRNSTLTPTSTLLRMPS